MTAKPKGSLLLKITMTVLLVTAFVWLFPDFPQGAGVGLFALGWLLGLLLTRPALRARRLSSAIALAAAGFCVVALAYDPGPLAWAMFWSAISIAALLPRTAGFDDAWHWTARLILQGLSGPLAPFADLRRLIALRPRGKRRNVQAIVALLALPLLGTGIFVALFANANPVIADALSHIRLPRVDQLAEWTLVTLLVWPAMRPRALVTRLAARIGEPAVSLPGTSLPSVVLALIMFNAVFAIQNGLDVAFLWSGAPLPTGMSMTEYVHRGAYPLIFTALLAGFLVLTMLRPGTPSADNRLVRRLVGMWVAQNLFLVASSALRTVEYIEFFLLTAWRIAALAWMGLVAFGLILIFWKILSGKSGRWLINANALAALVVLVPCCFVDLDAIAATWNVRHAREVGGRGAPLDLCYLDELGSAALLPLIEIERKPLAPALIDQLRYLRQNSFDGLAQRQADWHRWTPHGAIRLARAQLLLGAAAPGPAPLLTGDQRDCDGIDHREVSQPLTAAPAQ